jgi:integrase
MKSKSVVLEKFKQLLEVKYSGTTPDNYLYHVELFLTYCKNVPERVNNEDILNYNISVRNTSNSYRNVAINAIKAYFTLYLRKKVKGFASIRPPKQKRTVKTYNAELIAAKINQVPNLKHKAILSIALSGWLRVSEVINLKIEDINKDLMLIHVKNSKQSKDRDVVLSEKTLLILRDYFSAYFTNYKKSDYLFTGASSLKYSSSSCNAICKKYLDPNMRFHNLRATGATYAHENGMSLLSISEMLGHSKIETTKAYLSPIIKNAVQVI